MQKLSALLQPELYPYFARMFVARLYNVDWRKDQKLREIDRRVSVLPTFFSHESLV